MAHLSPSPSGGSSHRLSELLEQQQEPFSLDLYLLEKGCSPALLDAAAGGGAACSPCWPRTRSAGREPWRPAAASKNGSPGTLPSGVLRLLVSRILRATTTAGTAKRKQPQQAAIDWGRFAGGKPKRSSTAKNAGAPSSRPHRAVEAGAGEAGEEVAEDDGSSKQLSPVSVLEHRLFEHPPPPPPQAQKAGMVVILRELLPAACTPTLLDLLASAKGGRGDDSKQSRGRGTSPPARRQHLSKEEFATVTDLVASEMAAAWVGPRHLQPERRDVADDIAAAVLDSLTKETAAELMATGDDCAADTATGRCCCG